MRSVLVHEIGGAFVETDLPRPIAAAGEVLVRVHASSVNPLDTKIRAGAAPHARHPFPAVLGMDLAGVVEAVGPGVAAFRVGDAVYGLTGGVGGLQGSLAEFAAVDADLLALKPDNISMREAAALPLAVITAWEGLVDRAATRAGHKVLVHGGAGGVGHIAVQLARALGADVYATVRAAQFDVVRADGATPIDFQATDVTHYVEKHTAGDGFDVVYDTVGGSTLDASFLAARRNGGHVVSCLGWGAHALAPLSFRAATYSGVFALMPMLSGIGRDRHGHILRQARTLVEDGRLRPRVDARRFGLRSAMAAHTALASARSGAKIIVDVAV